MNRTDKLVLLAGLAFGALGFVATPLQLGMAVFYVSEGGLISAALYFGIKAITWKG